MLWDREEIGSDGATGAKSGFGYALADVLDAWEPDAGAPCTEPDQGCSAIAHID